MWVEQIGKLLRGTRRQWRLYDGTGMMECFITSCEGSSAEILFEYRGEEYHRFVHATRDDAHREAQEKRTQLTQLGWRDHPADEGDGCAASCEG